MSVALSALRWVTTLGSLADSPVAPRLAISDVVILSVLILTGQLGTYGWIGVPPALGRNVMSWSPPFFFRRHNAVSKSAWGFVRSTYSVAVRPILRLNFLGPTVCFCDPAAKARKLTAAPIAIIASTANTNGLDRIFMVSTGLTSRV